jgi:3-oxoacyl-[acyl-carrier protein] reductase
MNGKTVLVTGASGVIGQAITSALHQENFQVHAHYFSHAETLPQISTAVHQADLRDPDQVKVLFEEIPAPDAIIHAAAISHDTLVARTSPAQWQETMQLNLSGTFYVLQNALRHLPDGRRVVILGSRVGEHGNRGQAAYAASKAGVIALAQTAAREAAARQIAINVLCPPFVPSAMSNFSDSQRDSQLLFKNQNSQDALDAICSAVLWLLSEDAKFITGQVIHPDGRIGFGVRELAPALSP